jgi:hypothetical protein
VKTRHGARHRFHFGEVFDAQHFAVRRLSSSERNYEDFTRGSLPFWRWDFFTRIF